MPSSRLNLTSVDEAYGDKSDLYKDVLGIKPNASADQIQKAYFTRRDELFQVLSRMDKRASAANPQKRHEVKCRIDGVATALRVLGDPSSRVRYDAIRDERLGLNGSTSGSTFFRELDDEIPLATETPASMSTSGDVYQRRKLKSALKKRNHEDESSRSTLGELSVTIGNTKTFGRLEERNDESDSSPELPRPPPRTSAHGEPFEASLKHSSSKKSGSSRTANSHERGEGGNAIPDKRIHKVDEEDGEETSVGSAVTMGTSLTMFEAQRSVFQIVKDEVMGTIDDTNESINQVFNVFTLQEDDIAAVFGRIDKAKRQMENGFTTT